MNKTLTISVAAYNVESYLSKTLDSIVDAGDSRLEVIVVNDGSTDATASIARQYEQRYPEIVRVIDKENGGYGSTINASLRSAKGTYFKLLDGDDWYDADALPGFLDTLEKANEDLILSPFVKVFDTDGRRLPVSVSGVGGGKPVSRLSDIPGKTLLWMHSVAFKTSLLVDLNMPVTEHCFYTDTEFVTIPLSKVRTVLIDDHPVYQYRVGREGQSVSASGVLKHYREHEKVVLKLLKYYDNEVMGSCDNPSLVRYRIVHDIVLHYIFLYLIADSRKLQDELDRFNGFMSEYADYSKMASEFGTLAKLGAINNRLLNKIGHARARQLYPA